jgi:hypothetical protein
LVTCFLTVGRLSSLGRAMSLVGVLGSIGMAFGRAPKLQPRPSELYPAYFDSLPSMAGKTVVVTGASRGLGYVTALSVARKGAAVFLVGRSSARADAALDAIRSASTGPAPQLVECDLLDFGSVRKAAAALRECAGDGPTLAESAPASRCGGIFLDQMWHCVDVGPNS